MYMITHSLLSSWLYAMKEDPFSDATTEQNPFDDFLATLRRQHISTSEAMQKGIDFENLVTSIIKGEQHLPVFIEDAELGSFNNVGDIANHPWYNAARKAADIIKGGTLQYSAKKIVTISGTDLLLYGRLDALKAGTVFDIKFSGSYERGKYFTSTQHPMYLELVPEAQGFTYLVSNGTEVWTEAYQRNETNDIYTFIGDFMQWLQATELWNVYCKHWEAL